MIVFALCVYLDLTEFTRQSYQMKSSVAHNGHVVARVLIDPQRDFYDKTKQPDCITNQWRKIQRVSGVYINRTY